MKIFTYIYTYMFYTRALQYINNIKNVHYQIAVKELSAEFSVIIMLISQFNSNKSLISIDILI